MIRADLDREGGFRDIRASEHEQALLASFPAGDDFGGVSCRMQGDAIPVWPSPTIFWRMQFGLGV